MAASLPDGDCACTHEILFDCGCGEDSARTYRDDVVHWRGLHWRAGCSQRAAVREVARLEEALRMVAGHVDSCGHTHGSGLHDVGAVARLAERVLEGDDPHDALGK